MECCSDIVFLCCSALLASHLKLSWKTLVFSHPKPSNPSDSYGSPSFVTMNYSYDNIWAAHGPTLHICWEVLDRYHIKVSFIYLGEIVSHRTKCTIVSHGTQFRPMGQNCYGQRLPADTSTIQFWQLLWELLNFCPPWWDPQIGFRPTLSHIARHRDTAPDGGS